MIQTNCKFQKSDKFVETEIDGEILMMSVDDGQYFGMDNVAVAIWKFLVEPKSFTEIRDMVTTHFDVPKEECEQDIEAFLTDLINNKLITKVDVK